MAESIGHKGWFDIITTAHGATRKLRLVSFEGRSDTGDIEHSQFGPDYRVARILNTHTGLDATSHFDTALKLGAITQTDTGTGIGPYIAFAFPSDGGPLIQLSSSSIAENAAGGTVIGTASVASAPEGVTYTWAITSDPDSKFAIDESTGVLSLGEAATLNFEDAQSHQVTIAATPSAGDPPSPRTFTITVTNVLEVTLAALSLDTNEIEEDSAEDTVVGALQNVSSGSTLSLTDDAGGRFKVSGTNIVAGVTATDYDVSAGHNITVRETHSDAINSPRDTVVSIQVVPNTLIELSASTVDEDATIGTVIGTLSVAGGSGPYAFTITADPDSKFAVANDDELQTAAALDFEIKTSHSVTIQADNGIDTPLSRTFTITVGNVVDDENAPEILSLFPVDNAFGVWLNTGLAIQFNKPIALGETVLIRLYKTSGDVLVKEWTEADFLWEATNADTLEILIDPLEEDTAYYVTIASGSIESADGVAFGGISDETTWNFSTAAGIPNAFVFADWSIASGNEEASVTINSLPHDGGSAITDIEYRLDGGSWVSSGGTSSFAIAGLTNDQEYDVELRAVNANGESPASDVKAVTPASVGWTPLEPSAAAVVWIDPSDLSSMKKEITGASASTAAEVDDVVGTILNKGSAGGYLVAPSDGARPTLRESGGLYWLEFVDANDDALESQSNITVGSNDVTLAVGVRFDVIAAYAGMAGVIATSGNEYTGPDGFFLSLGSSGHEGRVGVMYEADTLVESAIGSTGTEYVFVAQKINDTTISNARNKGTPITTTRTGGGIGPSKFKIGRGGLDGRVYQAVLAPDDWTGDDLDDLWTFMGNKQGLSL